MINNKLADSFAESFQNKENKYYAVMLFYNTKEFDPTSDNDEWICRNIVYFNNYKQSLDYYANTPCTASQHIEAKTPDELQQKIQQMKNNFQNKTWIHDNFDNIY